MSVKVYDKVKYHSHADTAPKDMPYEFGATHIAFFFRWCFENNMLNKEVLNDIGETVNLTDRNIDFRQILIDQLDGVLTNEEMNASGKKFGNAYYSSDRTKFAKAFNYYLEDYSKLIRDVFGDKHEENSYFYFEYNEKNYETVKQIIDERYQQYLNLVKK